MQRNAKPLLEPLESRDLLACLVSGLRGPTLRITDRTGSDKILITDDGDGADAITVKCGSQTRRSRGVIQKVVVSAFFGNDRVNYTLTSELDDPRQLTVGLGPGNDTFTANLNADELEAKLVLKVNGNEGHDRLVLKAPSLNIDPGARLNAYFQGGRCSGADLIAVNYAGIMSGVLDIRADGENGEDTIAVNLALLAGSFTQLGALIIGSDGNDRLTLNIEGANGFGLIDGGNGTDQCFHLGNLSDVRNCEA
jgi:hypothetical protein